MRYSILTPTILRPSLLRACASIDSQTCSDWEHIVMVDVAVIEGDGEDNGSELLEAIAHPQRTVLRCERPHKNWGHSCRHRAWARAQGDYVYCLDDDNYLAHDGVLDYLKKVSGRWAIFPIRRLGETFFYDPPGLRLTDTGSILVRRELGPWPDSAKYEADGLFVEGLKQKYPYQVMREGGELMVMPVVAGA